MHYYFDAPESSKKFPGRRRITLPICIDNDLREAAKSTNLSVKKFDSENDLQTLKILATDRKKWRKFTKLIIPSKDEHEPRL